MSNAEKEVAARVCVPGSRQHHTTNHGLPGDVMDKAITRLGWLGLLFAATLLVVHWARISFTPFQGSAGGMQLANAAVAAGTILGIVVCALAWTRRLPQRAMLDAGLLFQVAAS